MASVAAVDRPGPLEYLPAYFPYSFALPLCAWGAAILWGRPGGLYPRAHARRSLAMGAFLHAGIGYRAGSLMAAACFAGPVLLAVVFLRMPIESEGNSHADRYLTAHQ
ncbi:MAG: hypothetical protein QGI29_06665 [Pirellulales bacterium]|nr:hypothetical protein [Pirellulales bacterium]